MTPAWECSRSGDCCTNVPNVQMTLAERKRIEAAVAEGHPTVKLQWRVGDRPVLTKLKAAPCPLFARDEDGRGLCTVYDVRPYQCRRYMCGRREPAIQPWDPRPVPLRILTSSALRADYARTQAVAQLWALEHGWNPEW